MKTSFARTVAASLAAAIAFASPAAFAQASVAATAPAPAAEPKVTVETLKSGEGAPPPAGSWVLVNYKGLLSDGTQFDAADGMPLDLSNVVPGFAQGLMQMQRGGHYRMTIPPELGYGAEASGPIPANSTLIFEVDLIDYKTPDEIAEIMAAVQKQQEMAAMQRIEAAKAAAAAGTPQK
ncbi:FKBP-type peptidyl-prolyl cis-trans isomerase [Novosphingobium sp. 1949]|uniref:Peptidyl-prolyl cis-trans isomerase n=1 Tax=Novosphingobium organovorum TaxID=2930092 RepID=A0ABT0BFV7_9SPHN|nr:FKBP-type peptidyl-prolyl cis-trans isomerase [Novosphingobium organovorum]MCJ2183951.1 FKBP-type peptidyl-prolyl cis-trans isomerase [Novosphingobium organovorum]